MWSVNQPCTTILALAFLCVPCSSFQIQGHGLFDSGPTGMLKCRDRIGTNSQSSRIRDSPVCFSLPRNDVVLHMQNPSKRASLSRDISDPSSSSEKIRGTVDAVAAEDSDRFCQLLVDVFEPPKEELGVFGMEFVHEWVRKAWWLNLYLGVVQRIFIASFVRGMREGSTDTPQKADIQTSPDEFHAMFGIDDDQRNFCGVVELNCMPCPIPPAREEGSTCFHLLFSPRAQWAHYVIAAMIARCEEEARAWGSDEIFLTATVENENALLLYHKLGYVTEMIEPLATRQKPRVYMRKLLDSDTAASFEPRAAPAIPDALSVTVSQGQRRVHLSEDSMYRPVPHPLLQYAGPLTPILVSGWAILAFLLF